MTTLNLISEYVKWYSSKYRSSPNDVQIQNFVNCYLDMVEGYTKRGYSARNSIEIVFNSLNR